MLDISALGDVNPVTNFLPHTCNVCGRNLIPRVTSAASTRVNISSTCKLGKNLGVSLPLLTCSPSAWPSRLLYRRDRKSRRDLWITLCVYIYIYIHTHTHTHTHTYQHHHEHDFGTKAESHPLQDHTQKYHVTASDANLVLRQGELLNSVYIGGKLNLNWLIKFKFALKRQTNSRRIKRCWKTRQSRARNVQKCFLDAFAWPRKPPVNFVMSVRPPVRLSACIGAAPTWRTSAKFDTAGFQTNLSKNAKFC